MAAGSKCICGGDMMAELMQATWESLYMVGVSSLIALALGLPLGVLLVISQKAGIKENTTLYRFLDVVINLLRSLPFIILMILVFPLSKALLGRKTGTTAMIVPLAIAAAPFVARLMEQSINEVDKGEVEAATAMGSSNWQIVSRVLIPEALPSMVNSMTITVINIIGYSAMAGAIGGGGLGDLAVRYGYYKSDYLTLLQAVVVIIVIVTVIQLIGNKVSRAIDRK